MQEAFEPMHRLPLGPAIRCLEGAELQFIWAHELAPSSGW